MLKNELRSQPTESVGHTNHSSDMRVTTFSRPISQLKREEIIAAVVTLRARGIQHPFPEEVATVLKIATIQLRYWVKLYRDTPNCSWAALGMSLDQGSKPSAVRIWLSNFIHSLRRASAKQLAVAAVLELYQNGQLSRAGATLLCVAIASSQHRAVRLDQVVAKELKVSAQSLFYVLHGKTPSRNNSAGIFGLVDSELKRRLDAEGADHTIGEGNRVLKLLRKARIEYIRRSPFSAALAESHITPALAKKLIAISQEIPSPGQVNPWGLTNRERQVVGVILDDMSNGKRSLRPVLAARANLSESSISQLLHGQVSSFGAIAKLRHHAELVGGVSAEAMRLIEGLASHVKPSLVEVAEVRALLRSAPDRDPPISLRDNERVLLAEVVRRSVTRKPRSEKDLAAAIGVTRSGVHVIMNGQHGNGGLRSKMDRWISERSTPSNIGFIRSLNNHANRPERLVGAEEVLRLTHALGPSDIVARDLAAGFVDLALASGKLPSLAVRRKVVDRIVSDPTDDEERMAIVRALFSGRYSRYVDLCNDIVRITGSRNIAAVPLTNLTKFIYGRDEVSDATEGAVSILRARLEEGELGKALKSSTASKKELEDMAGKNTDLISMAEQILASCHVKTCAVKTIDLLKSLPQRRFSGISS